VIDLAFLLHDLSFRKAEVVLNLVVQLFNLLLQKLLLVNSVLGVRVSLHLGKVVSLLLRLIQVLPCLNLGWGNLLRMVLREVLLKLLPGLHAVAKVLLIGVLRLALVNLALHSVHVVFMLLLSRLLVVARLLLVLMMSLLLKCGLLLFCKLLLVASRNRWGLRDHWLVFLHDNILLLGDLHPQGLLFGLFVLHWHRLTSLLSLHLFNCLCLILLDSPLLDLIVFTLLEFVTQESHDFDCSLIDDLSTYLFDWVAFDLKGVDLLVEADPIGNLFHFVIGN
jgi:hypothetical protein